MTLSNPTARLAGMVFCVAVLVGSLLWFGGSMFA
jgi:hypothetical protein